jgi:hypothetical protein
LVWFLPVSASSRTQRLKSSALMLPQFTFYFVAMVDLIINTDELLMGVFIIFYLLWFVLRPLLDKNRISYILKRDTKTMITVHRALTKIVL